MNVIKNFTGFMLAMVLSTHAIALSPPVPVDIPVDLKDKGKEEILPIEPPVQTQSTNTDSNPNYCYQNDLPPKDCAQGQIHNCHLNMCVEYHANEQYNEEYKNCAEAEDTNACQNNLKEIHQEISDVINSTNNTESASGSMAKLSKVANTGLGLAGLYVAFALKSKACTGGPISLSVAGGSMAILGFMGMQKDQSKSIKRQLDEHMKKVSEFHDKGGWSKNSEVQGLKTQIQYLKQLEQMSSQALSAHNTQRNFYAIAGAAAGACLAWFGCPMDPCATAALAVSGVGMTIETLAGKEAKKAKDKASDAREKAEALLAKIEKLYDNNNKGNSSLANQNGTGDISNGSGSSNEQVTDVRSDSGQGMSNNQEEVISFNTDDVSSACVGKDLSLSKSSCANPMTFSLPTPDSNIGRAVNKKLDFASTAATMSAFAKGDYSGLNNSKLASDKMSAVGQKVFRKVAQKTLKVGKTLKPSTKSALSSIASGDPSELIKGFTSKIDPTATIASASKNGFLNGRSEGLLNNNQALSSDSLQKAVKSLTGGKGLNELSQLDSTSNKFPQGDGLIPQDGSIDLGEDNNEGFDLQKEMRKLGSLESSSIADANGVIHPDQKISIFKIITNRYNYMRVRKSFGQ